MAYLNTRTGEYPRFAGDVQLSPNDSWAVVEPLTPPVAQDRQIVYEGKPELMPSGVYRQTWVVEEFTEEEWEARRIDGVKARLADLGLTVEDLKNLLA